jgi:hypothetical protein
MFYGTFLLRLKLEFIMRKKVGKPGLPDGLFSNQKSQDGYNFRVSFNGRCCYMVWPFNLFHCHLVYYVAIWYILWLFGIFSHFGMLYQEQSGNPVEGRGVSVSGYSNDASK